MSESVAERIKRYWEWFLSEQARLSAQPEEERVDELYEAVCKIDDQLAILAAADPSHIEVIFTAHGDRSLMPVVSELVAAAPVVPGWTFVAFKPPAGESFTHQRAGVSVRSTQIRFMPMESRSNPSAIGVKLFVPRSVIEHDECEDVVWNVFMTAAGELLASQVAHLEPRDIAETTVEASLPLSDLARYLEWRLQRR